MRRILAITLAGALLMAFAAGSTAARTTRLAYAHAQLSLDGTTPIGWIDFSLTTPTAQDPSPGFIEFNGVPSYDVRSLEVLATDAGFYWDDTGAAGTWGQGWACMWSVSSGRTCEFDTFWILDTAKGGDYDADWFVLAPADNESDWTWYRVISGDIVVQAP